MHEINWASKLTSRKFWMALAGFIVGAVGFLKNPTTDAEAITNLIMALGSILAYCIGEGLVDAERAKSDTIIVEPDKPPEDDDDMR